MEFLDPEEKKYLYKLEKQFSYEKPSKIKEIIGWILLLVVIFFPSCLPKKLSLLPKGWDIFYIFLFLLFPLSVYQYFKSYDNQWKAWSIIRKLKLEMKLKEKQQNMREK